MLRILDTAEQSANQHRVFVRPTGFAATGGKLLAGPTNKAADAHEVGEWNAPASGDGDGLATTPRGVFLFATQGVQTSDAFPLFAVVPDPQDP